MRLIQDYNFYHKKVLVRVDFNVPIDDQGQITDTSRIDLSLSTIQKVLSDQGAVILISHLGRPGKNALHRDTFSLHQLIPYLQHALGMNILFAKDCIGPDTIHQVQDLQPAQVLLLENVRFHPEEEQGDPIFAQSLAILGDIYINDAFATIHRKHASTYTITNYIQDKFAGCLFQQEISNANKVLANIQHPFTVIIGGNKIDDKLPVIDALLEKLDTLLVGGGVANNFHQALGKQIGNSVVAHGQEEIARTILKKASDLQKPIILPQDWVIAQELAYQAETQIVQGDDILSGWKTVDIGPSTTQLFQEVIAQSKTILWAGPLGIFEIPAFSHGTQDILAAVAKATQEGAFSLIGGGDSATAVTKFGYRQAVSYISTGGGALLAYLANPQLPVVEALHKSNNQASI